YVCTLTSRYTGIRTISLHDALPISDVAKMDPDAVADRVIRAVGDNELFVFTHPEYEPLVRERHAAVIESFGESAQPGYHDPSDLDRKSTRLNSSHVSISYAVFC